MWGFQFFVLFFLLGFKTEKAIRRIVPVNMQHIRNAQRCISFLRVLNID